MSSAQRAPRSIDAVIFDLDGVITQTARLHAQAWKATFDAYLRMREVRQGEPFSEFAYPNDYLAYVDGRPRYLGVEAFLRSRGIGLPFGAPSDGPDRETCCGIGNRKDLEFNRMVREQGVQTYPSTVRLVHRLREQGVRVGVASSSRNCRMVLEATQLLHLFDTLVDGETAAQLGLKGKPEPDIFIRACENLGVGVARTVVVEDAVSGVQAARRGGMGLVVGVARENNQLELAQAGAHVVVPDLAPVDGLSTLEEWIGHRSPS